MCRPVRRVQEICVWLYVEPEDKLSSGPMQKGLCFEVT